MSEQPPQDAPFDDADDVDADLEADDGRDVDIPDDATTSAPATTGHPAVDEVLRSLDDLASRPVDEHVAAFEDAHEKLRRALSSAGDE
jgi:hypothetical protein